MIKTIFVPLTTEVSSEQFFLLEARGEKTTFYNKAVDAREEAEAELNAALEAGYQMLHAEAIKGGQGVLFAIMLYKSDVGANDHVFLTAEGAEHLRTIQAALSTVQS